MGEEIQDRIVDYALALYKTTAEESLAYDSPDEFQRLLHFAQNEEYELCFEIEIIGEGEDSIDEDFGYPIYKVSLIYSKKDRQDDYDDIVAANLYFSEESMNEQKGRVDWFPNGD